MQGEIIHATMLTNTWGQRETVNLSAKLPANQPRHTGAAADWCLEKTSRDLTSWAASGPPASLGRTRRVTFWHGKCLLHYCPFRVSIRNFMQTRRHKFRCLLVAAVAMSLTASPFEERPAAGCAMHTARPAAPHKCCSDDECHCVACPCANSRLPAPPRSPTISSREHELVTLLSVPLQASSVSLTFIGAMDIAPLLASADFDSHAHYAAHLSAGVTGRAHRARLATCYRLSHGAVT